MTVATVRAEFFDDQLYGLCYMYGKLNYERQNVVEPFNSRDAVISGVVASYTGKYASTKIIAEIYTGTNLAGGVGDLSLKQGGEGGSVFGGYRLGVDFDGTFYNAGLLARF